MRPSALRTCSSTDRTSQGLATTKALALAGAKVYIASRSPPKVEAARTELLAAHPELAGRVEFLEIDLASLASAKKAGDEFEGKEKRLDGIVCNAGVMAVPYELTKVREVHRGAADGS